MANEKPENGGKKFPRGAKPSPRHVLAGAKPHTIKQGTPPQVIVVPPFLEMWLNDQYGDCVSAEEAFAKAAYSVMQGQPETKITDATLMSFCRKYDLLNGANLTPVMDYMIRDGFHQDNQTYNDGPYVSVDYSNEAVLRNAISIGPVKIGMDANALPSGAGNHNGWYAFGGSPGEFDNEDHCTSLHSFGPASALFAALGVSVPSGVDPNKPCYHHYTWSTIGVVDHDWIMSTCGEVWLRNPTTPGIVPIPPVCPPGTHLDPVTNTCIPDGPIPPVPVNQQVVIPGQTAYASLLGFHLPVNIPGQTVPVTNSSHFFAPVGGTTIVLPPWLLAELRLLCASPLAQQFPFSLIAGLLCPLIPPGLTAGPMGATITIPPFVLNVLRFICNFAAFIPPPYSAALVALCALLPTQAKSNNCGGCQG